MLQNLINQIASRVVTNTMIGIEAEDNETKNLKQQIVSLICSQNMSSEILSITDKSRAMAVFTSLACRKDAHDFVPLVAYYFSSMVINDPAVTGTLHKIAIKNRLINFFYNLDKFERIVQFAQSAPMFGYQGNLDETEFMDFLIMGDAYQVCDIEPNDRGMNSIRRLVVQHEPSHPTFSKSQIISEGNKAHKAVLDVIKMTLLNQ